MAAASGAGWVADMRGAHFRLHGYLLGGFYAMAQGPIPQGADQGFASLKERLEADEAATGA